MQGIGLASCVMYSTVSNWKSCRSQQQNLRALPLVLKIWWEVVQSTCHPFALRAFYSTLILLYQVAPKEEDAPLLRLLKAWDEPVVKVQIQMTYNLLSWMSQCWAVQNILKHATPEKASNMQISSGPVLSHAKTHWKVMLWRNGLHRRSLSDRCQPKESIINPPPKVLLAKRMLIYLAWCPMVQIATWCER